MPLPGHSAPAMERQRELLAETVWRIGTRIQTGWWFTPLGRILDAQSTLDEGQIFAICEQSRPASDRQAQQVVFELHAGKHLEARTAEERREWIVTLLTAFRIDWNGSLRRQDDMESLEMEEMLDIRNQVMERYERSCRKQEVNQAARKRARMQETIERCREAGPSAVVEDRMQGREESGQAAGTSAEDPEMRESQATYYQEQGTPYDRRDDDPGTEVPEPWTTPQGRHSRPRNWEPGDVVILQRPTSLRPQNDPPTVQRHGGGRPPWAEPRRAYPPHHPASAMRSGTRTRERTGRQASTLHRAWTDRDRWGSSGQNGRHQGWGASATTPPWMSHREAPQGRRRRYGDGRDNIRLAVQVQASIIWARPPWAGGNGHRARIPPWQYPGLGDDVHAVSDGEESEEGDGRHGPCVICCERNATRIIWDCGHIVTCGKCVRELFRLGRANGVSVTCPQCRKRVWDTRRAFPVSLGTGPVQA